MNRRLIRPSLGDLKDKMRTPETAPKPPMDRPDRPDRPDRQDRPDRPPHPSQSSMPPKKIHPPTDTFAENYYYLKQMGKKTPMAVIFQDGERIEGYIEWYDRNCIKVNREGAPNLLVYKAAIKYIYKMDEAGEGGGPPSSAKK